MAPSYEEGLQKTIDPKVTHPTDFRFAIFDVTSTRVNQTVRTEPFQTERGIEPEHGIVKPHRANLTVRTEPCEPNRVRTARTVP